jgi:hypothetical protein
MLKKQVASIINLCPTLEHDIWHCQYYLPRTSISRRRIKDVNKDQILSEINATLSYAIRTGTINIGYKHQSVTNIFEYKLKVMILVQIATEIWNDAISIDIKKISLC